MFIEAMNLHPLNPVPCAPAMPLLDWHKGSAVLRKRRQTKQQQRQAYLVTTNTEQRAPRFTDLTVAREVILIMKALHDYGLLHSHAFVLMPDHLHWLITLTHGSLESAVEQFKALSARTVQRKSGAHDWLWQRGFDGDAIRHDESIIHIARYIVANPVRAKLVEIIHDYPHWDAE
jgi:putative transposase